MTIITTPRSKVITLIDFLLTTLAWFAFCYLFAAGMRPILDGRIRGLDVPVVSRLLPHVHTLLVYGLVAVCIAGLLFVWASYNAVRFGGLDRRTSPPALTDAALATSFDVNSGQLKILHSSQITRIHHTEEGQISLIDFAGDRPPSDNVVQLPWLQPKAVAHEIISHP